MHEMTMRSSTNRDALAVAIVLCAIMFSCDTSVRVGGTVRNHDGTPLEGVSVTLQTQGRGPHTTTTDKNGTFTIGMVGADPTQVTLVFEKPGFKTLHVPFDPKQTSLQVELDADPTRTTH